LKNERTAVFNPALQERGPCGPTDLKRGGHFKNEGAKCKKKRKINSLKIYLFHGILPGTMSHIGDSSSGCKFGNKKKVS